MAGEIIYRGGGTGQTTYFRILGSGGCVWSTSGGTGGFESYNSADWTDYAISATEQGATNIYVGNFPAAVPAGVYSIDARRQIAGSPAVSDTGIAQGEEQWNGSKTLPLSDLATSGLVAQIGPVKLARGVMVGNFPFYLVSATDHVTPLTSGICSGQISRDGGAFGALQSGAFTEVGLGTYALQAFTSGDLLCNTAMVIFRALGISGGLSDPRPFSFVLQRVSGSL